MIRIFVLLIILAFSAIVWGEVEIDEYGSARSVSKYETQERGFGHRKVGLGIAAGGVAGIFGANLELNFTEQTGFNAGFGLSTDYQSLFVGLKHVLTGTQVMPYVSGGYARWFSNGNEEDVGDTTPGFVGKRFLSENERRTGIFGENLIYGGLGIQFLQTSGDFEGSSIYAEVLGIIDIDDLVFEPNAGLGYMYYF